MSRVIFTAPSTQDSVTPTTFYGVGHQADITDEAYVRSLIASGKASYMGATIRNVLVHPVAATTATVNWIVDQPCTAMKIDYGPTSAYGSSVTGSPASGQGAVTAAISSLTTKTTYHYRVSVTFGSYVTMTPDLTFTTA